MTLLCDDARHRRRAGVCGVGFTCGKHKFREETNSHEEGLAALDGSTALHAAAKYDNKEAVAILKEFAREDWPMLLSHRNRAGQMAYELAPDRSSLFDVLYCGNR